MYIFYSMFKEDGSYHSDLYIKCFIHLIHIYVYTNYIQYLWYMENNVATKSSTNLNDQSRNDEKFFTQNWNFPVATFYNQLKEICSYISLVHSRAHMTLKIKVIKYILY